MPSKRLADLRVIIKDMAGARAVANQIALIEVRLAVAKARLAQRIANIKAKHEADTDADMTERSKLRALLSDYIDSNRDKFKRPRKVQTELASFGLQAVNEVVIFDEEALLDFVFERGYEDCFQTVRKPVKSAIRARIDAGEMIPGVSLHDGDTAVCTPHSSVIKKATDELSVEADAA